MVDGLGALGKGVSAAGDVAKDAKDAVDTTTGGLLKRKHARFFEVLDADRNGSITEDDLTALGRKMAEATGHGEDSARARELSSTLREIWAEYDRSLVDGRERLSRDDVVRILIDYGERRPDRLITFIGQLSNILFAMSDQDGDGKIDKEESVRLTPMVWSVTKAEAETAWSKIDVLNRGYLDYPQYLTAVTEFMTSVNPVAPGNWIFGRF
ncbi:hypothetical protein [Amycolatopsis minnesotensis]|uniref:EF-hand domain-containing protein n=1 Tax=Amycolatopsis minnesotensis TaxID=337894 RepID=A0ABN2QRI5_9PSEU